MNTKRGQKHPSEITRKHQQKIKKKKKRKKEFGAVLQMTQQTRHKLTQSKWVISFALAACLLAFVQKDCTCLKISSIEVPAAAWNGSQVTFVCNYELAPDDQLYSVKWYKNYVEFYRFQPQAQDGTQAQVGQNLNLNQQTGGARHEFELEGINLDVSKSNATHVQLRQVNLSSEATFKCEVSADSPTFATVSAERQMKIFVLPKQKLALVDNSNAANSNVNAMAPLAAAVQQQQQSGPARPLEPQVRLQNNNNNNAKQLIYQLNDLLNFTCIAGASRPSAHLSWLLNDELLEVPINGNNKSSTSASKLQALDIIQEQRALPNELIEVRSTLTLRLQASHLKLLRKQATNLQGRQQSSSSGGFSSSILPIKLSCLAQLSVSFASETSVLVANGGQKTPIANKRRKSTEIFPVPAAASWMANEETTTSSTSDFLMSLNAGRSRRRNQANANLDDNLRWLSSGEQATFKEPERFKSFEGFSDSWHEASQASGEETTLASTSGGSKRTRSRHNNVVWTQRQLRAQAEHISQLVRRWRPNDLETPHIEAKPVAAMRIITTTSAPTTSFNANFGSVATTTTEGADEEAEEAEELEEEARRSAASSPSLIIPGNQFGGGEALLAPPASGRTNSYDLDEQVNFTCHSMMLNNQDQQQQRRPNPLYSVQVKWFINNHEIISSNRINAFDGQRFYLRNTLAGDEAASFANSHHETSTTTTNLREKRTMSNWLLIEFGASLLQLKELTLKCKIIVEQPLIEYENAQIISLASSPFIQAAQEQRRPSTTSFNVRPSSTSGARLQSSIGLNNFDHSQPSHGPRNNVIRMRQSQQARSHAPKSTSTSTALQLAALIGSTFLVTFHNYFMLTMRF